MQPLLADSLIEVKVFKEGLFHHTPKKHTYTPHEESRGEVVKRGPEAKENSKRRQLDKNSPDGGLTIELQDKQLCLPACHKQPPS